MDDGRTPSRQGSHEADAERRNERMLLRQFARTRDQRIREQLVERFTPLARSLALRYQGGAEPVEDLFQVASVGLLKAIDGFDPDRRSDFAAYAAPTILGELRHYFRDQTWSVHLPRGLQERSARINDVSERLAGELHRPPTADEIALHAGLTPAQVLEAMQAERARRTTSLDVPSTRGEEDSAPVVETLGERENGYERAESEIASEDAGLRNQEREALRLRFHEGLTQREIGSRIGVSQMQVSRLLRRALKKLLTAVRGEKDETTAAPEQEVAGEPEREPVPAGR